MKVFNFMANSLDTEVYNQLVNFIVMDFSYFQANEFFKEKGYYIPEDQYYAFSKVLDIQLDLEIGTRIEEHQ